jgi:hypothetical protein
VPSEWGIHAQIRNAYRPPTSVEHVCYIPVRVRLDWRTKDAEIIEAVATGWRGRLVRVHLAEHGVEVWLIANDVRRLRR